MSELEESKSGRRGLCLRLNLKIQGAVCLMACCGKGDEGVGCLGGEEAWNEVEVLGIIGVDFICGCMHFL